MFNFYLFLFVYLVPTIMYALNSIALHLVLNLVGSTQPRTSYINAFFKYFFTWLIVLILLFILLDILKVSGEERLCPSETM